MTFKQSILELQHCNKCNSDMCLFLISVDSFLLIS